VTLPERRSVSPAPASGEAAVYDSARRPHPFIEEALELFRHRELAVQWSLRTIKLRYKRSVLGVLWTLLEPLLLMIILTVVFSAMFRMDVPHYPVYVLTGLSFFDFVRRSTTAMVDEILASQSLARRIHVPRSAFALASILTYLINWLLALIPLAGVMLIFRHPFSPGLLTLPAAMALTAIFALGVGLLVATLAAFFDDINLTYQVLVTAWMYATPIIYPLSIVEPELRRLLLFNPLVPLLELVRVPIYDAGLPGGAAVASGASWLAGLALATGALLAGWWCFTRWRDAFDYRA
jgi:ABC-type polysaccharide/polyol phosphate export permease